MVYLAMLLHLQWLTFTDPFHVENPLDDIVIKNHSQKKDLSYLGGNGGLVVVENQ